MFYWLVNGYVFIGPLHVWFFHLSYEYAARPYGLRAERIVVAAMTIFVLLVMGGRAYFLAWLVGLALFAAAEGRFSFYRQVVLLTALPLAGGLLGIYQKISSVGKDALRLGFPENVFYRLSSSYDQFEHLVNMLNYPIAKFDWGYSIIEDVFITYVPRFIIPWKPVDYGYIRAQNLFFGDIWSVAKDTTYPVGSLAELYFNFDMPGITLGMAFLGIVLALLRRWAFYDPRLMSVFCAIGALCITPHRWYGVILLNLYVYLIVTLCAVLFAKVLGVLIERRMPRAA
jgi:hypothetical protein